MPFLINLCLNHGLLFCRFKSFFSSEKIFSIICLNHHMSVISSCLLLEQKEEKAKLLAFFSKAFFFSLNISDFLSLHISISLYLFFCLFIPGLCILRYSLHLTFQVTNLDRSLQDFISCNSWSCDINLHRLIPKTLIFALYLQ